MKASAIAPANIALVKYWGKRDEELILPFNGSISVTLDKLFAHTTVEFDERYKEDILILNGKRVEQSSKDYQEYIGNFLRKFRERFGKTPKVKIESVTNFPTGAGLASSAAGFAALATAINEALGLNLDKKELSKLARLGSGSATRSIYGGFVEWLKGERNDGEDSYAIQIAPPEHWKEFRMILCITSKEEKKIKSRAGMAQTVKTSPMYKCWLESVEKDLEDVRAGILGKDLELVGKVAEHNCLKMFATMLTTKPPIIYWNETSIRLIHSILEWRDEGIKCYFTMDAGPQVKVICLEKDEGKIRERLKEIEGVEDIIVTSPGDGAKVTEKHLF